MTQIQQNFNFASIIKIIRNKKNVRSKVSRDIFERVKSQESY